MLKLMKLIVFRITSNKAFLIVYLLLIPIVMAMAIYFTNSMSYSMSVGIVGDVEIVDNEAIEYIYLDTMPATSKLVLNQYDAIIEQTSQGMEVTSTKGKQFDQAMQLLVSGQIDSLPSHSNTRGTASNILGFLMMVVSLLGVQIYSYYFDERNGINKRILGTSISCYQYMLSHFTVAFGFLFIPALLVICGSIWMFDIILSIALWQFILVLLLLCFFATAFGLWINSLSRSLEESMLFGNMFAIVGSIISGGFIQVTNNEIFNKIVQFLPQKQIMITLDALENSTTIPYLGISYVFIISIVLIVLAIFIEKRKLPSR